MNWKTKVLIQKTLSAIPAGENINHGLQWLNGGYTDAALRQRVLDRLPILDRITRYIAIRDAAVVEVGTGWELLDPLLMFVFGARIIHTYDHAPHLRFRVPHKVIDAIAGMKDLAVLANADQERIESLRGVESLKDLLSLCNIRYIAPGDASHTELPAQSIDLFFSIQVLEHVRVDLLPALIMESRRILKPSGVGFHIIDPGDHYCKWGTTKINFLRYSDRLWNFWIQNKISYHNRLRAREFIDAFVSCGCDLKRIIAESDPADVELLNDGFELNPRFARFTPEELAVHFLEVVHS